MRTSPSSWPKPETRRLGLLPPWHLCLFWTRIPKIIDPDLYWGEIPEESPYGIGPKKALLARYGVFTVRARDLTRVGWALLLEVLSVGELDQEKGKGTRAGFILSAAPGVAPPSPAPMVLV